MHDLHVTRATRWPWSVWPLPMYSRPFLGNLSNSTLIAASRAAWRPKYDEKRACLIHLILCFVNLLFFCCGKKGTWLEHGRIFSIKKIIYATRSVLKCGCRCHPNEILFVHFNHPAVMSTVKGHVWSIFPFTPPKRAASNTRWPMASTVQELHHTNWWIPMESLRTTYKYQFRSLILHVHTTSENPQLWS